MQVASPKKLPLLSYDMDIKKVSESFMACKKEDDVLLRPFCDAYTEVAKLLAYFGKLFYFVTRDVEHKLGILYEHHNREPQKYRSIRNMTAYEASRGITGDAHSGKLNGSRTLLRLNRALIFVIELMEALCTATEDESLRSMTKAIYDTRLAPFHPWPVRKAVSVAVYALPTREQLVSHICENQPVENNLNTREACRDAILQDALPAMRAVYDINTKCLESRNMLHLP
ncbi:glycolipid transfer protein [Opisthorchis viverrini]|uniref:Glycolipid transfer protein n=2 Tax=Opisthorchis viverrini TaxID=6198 RepID=A0A1S8XBK2_OPIVI|nr:hypothetical protein T265_04572 [Opisthorchis viverrini]KER28620.1 hypothetical protein T265_04572 [Opisthorchis viverrini]OON24077.1 glycolipid transfer protein [Opisthorchis viverrini]